MATDIIAFPVNLRKNNNRFNKGYVYFNLFWVRKYKKNNIVFADKGFHRLNHSSADTVTKLFLNYDKMNEKSS